MTDWIRLFWTSVVATALLTTMRSLEADAAERVVPDGHATIQDAIDSSVDGDSVIVHPGTYIENLDFQGKRIHVRSSGGATKTTIDASGLGGSVVVFQNGEGPESILEGFTITGGAGTVHQGGLYGGGVFCRSSSPTLVDNRIVENTADAGGGIACVEAGADPLIRSNSILENLAGSASLGTGGGIFVGDGGSPDILGNSLVRNRSIVAGGGIYTASREGVYIAGNTISASFGSGIFANFGKFLTIENNDFNANEDFAVDTIATSDIVIQQNRFNGNSGDLRIDGGESLHIAANTFSLTVGTAIFLSFPNGDVLVEQNIVWRPTGNAFVARGATSLLQNNAFGGARGGSVGGGIGATHGSSIEIVSCTVVGNSASIPGSGLYLSQGSVATVINSIFWANEGEGVATSDGASVEIGYSIIEGGWEGEGVLDVDPEIANMAAGDFHLRLGSPCIDAGYDASGELPEEDIDGDNRLLDGDRDGVAKIDIGADEHRWEIAVRYGYVNQTAEGVLSVNESVGDHERVVRVDVGEPLLIALDASSAGPDPARFVVYGWIDAPDVTTFTKQPFGLGWTVFPTPLQPVEVNQPVAVWNNLGRAGRLGTPTENSTPAPSTLLDLPSGVGIPATVTLQGFIEDLGSRAAGPISITNAVVMQIEETE